MNWIGFALKVPQIIGIAMLAVEKIKGAKGSEKEAAVIDTLNTAVASLESTLDLDFVNDAALHQLATDYIAAKVALMNGISAAKALKPVPNAPPS